MLKAVILIGGPQKGTRFRPLSFEVPKPLFPVAGVPMIQHHIEACAQVPGMQEILLIGFYQPDEALTQFLETAQQEFNLPVRYLQEFAPLGTGGGLYHFRDQILAGGPEAFFVLNADVCSDFPLSAMLDAHRCQRHPFLLLGTTANRTQSLNYGCIVENPQTHEVLHYVEKPSTFISDIINCGIYLFSPEALKPLRDVFQRNQQDGQLEDSPGSWPGAGTIRLEQDVFSALAGQGQIYVHLTDGIWSQIKSAGSALYASRLYLDRYQITHPERLAKHTPGGPRIRGNVYIHPTAKVAPSAVLVVWPRAGCFRLICSRRGLDLGSPRSLQDSRSVLLSIAGPQRLHWERGDCGRGCAAPRVYCPPWSHVTGTHLRLAQHRGLGEHRGALVSCGGDPQ
ncbi:PREDICTED: mannose-1-phosphate guanyltransferase alpha isoform X2 [Dipodomys ordii]|uniref:Mannose-1-phosphate guanyltransferase alpha isoform X2 n=1 Tax=Dipodomys ordii TaxID=10020 RepID=A0A1S3ESH2_DIPOR|nr:PREDICTED: mannose-1-phosphate guanyltransferase alpha isoform X2 [Dipodomys ordii]